MRRHPAGTAFTALSAAAVVVVIAQSLRHRRSFSWRWLRQRAQGDPSEIMAGSIVPVAGLTFTPDGGRLLILREDGSAELRERTGGKVLHTFPPPQNTSQRPGPQINLAARARVVVSPDGRWFAWFNARVGIVTIFDNESATAKELPLLLSGLTFSRSSDGAPRLLMVLREADFAPAMEPGGQTLLTLRHDGTDWQEESSWSAGGMVNAFAPDAARLLSVPPDRRQSVEVWDLAAQKRLRGIAMGAMTPDGASLASGAARHQIQIWNAVTGQTAHHLAGHTGLLARLAFAPDGSTLASAAFDDTVRLWHFPTARETGTAATGCDPATLHFTADGQTLFARSRAGEIVRITAR